MPAAFHAGLADLYPEETFREVSPDAQVLRRHFARSTGFKLIADACPVNQRGVARLLDCGDVDEYVRAAFIGFDETIALGCIEPLYSSRRHRILSTAYRRTSAFFAAIPASVIRYARSRPVPRLSTQRFSSNRCNVVRLSGSSTALTQPRSRRCCINCRSM